MRSMSTFASVTPSIRSASVPPWKVSSLGLKPFSFSILKAAWSTCGLSAAVQYMAQKSSNAAFFL